MTEMGARAKAPLALRVAGRLAIVLAVLHGSLAVSYLVLAFHFAGSLAPPPRELCYGTLCFITHHPLTIVPWAVFVVASAVHCLKRRAWARTRLERIAWEYVLWAAIGIVVSRSLGHWGKLLFAAPGLVHGLPWAIVLWLLRSGAVRSAMVDTDPQQRLASGGRRRPAKMTDKRGDELTPQHQELARKMRQMDEAARRQPERAPREPLSWEMGCFIWALVMFIVAGVAFFVYMAVMHALAEGIVGSILTNL